MEQHTLYELNEYVRQIIALNLPAPVWVSCEIYQLNLSRGHRYLSLVQKAEGRDDIIAQSDAVLWQGKFRKLERKLSHNLRHLLCEGTAVLLQVRVDFNERYGLKLVVEDIDLTYTMGQLEQQRRATLERLKQEQLLARNRNTLLPLVPQRLAVISSPTAAGLEDFVRQLEQNEYGYRYQVKVFPAAMQGSNAPAEIARQIQHISSLTRSYDAIVIARGGGARLDLAAFDDYELCVTAARCPLPVLTGIGHEIDEVLLDLVAHTALKTPTAVAEFLIDRAARLESQLVEAGHALSRLTQRQFSQQRLQLERWAEVLPLLAARKLQHQAQQIGQLQHMIPPAARQHLRLQQQQLQQFEQILHLLSPEATLKRGYTLTTVNGQPATSAKAAQTGATLTTRFKDGTVKSKVQ
ncbi:MAG: exodeoxyribonuclease VII large subunit [Phaeodactylibacter sp.]|uniref:exodeoxyribonuclease VII large subunit n=1 Tax=Phaeodactylibacter sp. TaxID=1940289 RepID=UPI0032EF6FFC